MDVDGVLNAMPWLAYKRELERPAPAWADMRSVGVRSHGNQRRPYRITYSPTLIRTIREMHELELVEVRWLTTWGTGANRFLADAIGLPQLKMAGKHPTKKEMSRLLKQEGKWWKRDIAVNAINELASDTPVIWTDDHLALTPVLRQVLANAGILTIAPDDMLGITPADMQQILSYLETGKVEVAA